VCENPEKHFQERAAEPQISPLRCASVEMTKGRSVLPRNSGCGTGAVLHHLGWSTRPVTPPIEHEAANIHTYSSASVQQPLFLGSTDLPFVISTEAQRSGEICGSAVLSWKCFSCRAKRSRGPAVSFFRVLTHALKPSIFVPEQVPDLKSGATPIHSSELKRLLKKSLLRVALRGLRSPYPSTVRVFRRL
jgi:hypothetical protein